jgi:hypothetical protein
MSRQEATTRHNGSSTIDSTPQLSSFFNDSKRSIGHRTSNESPFGIQMKIDVNNNSTTLTMNIGNGRNK